jgi:peptidoglycan/LPS O-acetylase OafA/YrhL
LLGSFLAIARTDTRTWQQVRAVAPYAFSVSLFVILAIARYQGHFYDFVAPGEFAGVRSSEPVLLIGLSMLAVFFSCVLVFVLDGPIYLTRLLEHPVFTRVGIYSYGIYIYHILVITAGLLIIHALPRRIYLPAVGQKMVLVFFELVFSTLIAALSFRYFESPILKWKSKFSEKPTASALV